MGKVTIGKKRTAVDIRIDLLQQLQAYMIDGIKGGQAYHGALQATISQAIEEFLARRANPQGARYWPPPPIATNLPDPRKEPFYNPRQKPDLTGYFEQQDEPTQFELAQKAEAAIERMAAEKAGRTVNAEGELIEREPGSDDDLGEELPPTDPLQDDDHQPGDIL